MNLIKSVFLDAAPRAADHAAAGDWGVTADLAAHEGGTAWISWA